jgi:hypothetical protein
MLLAKEAQILLLHPGALEDIILALPAIKKRCCRPLPRSPVR